MDSKHSAMTATVLTAEELKEQQDEHHEHQVHEIDTRRDDIAATFLAQYVFSTLSLQGMPG